MNDEENKKCPFGYIHWQCPNMEPVKGDTSMNYERYECPKCGMRYKLDYDFRADK